MCVTERPTPPRHSRRPSCLEAQRVLRVMLPRPRRILRRIANAGGGVGDGVAGAFGRVADGARQALGRVADGVAHTTDCREVVSNLMWEEREGGREREREEEEVRLEWGDETPRWLTGIARSVSHATDGLACCVGHAADNAFFSIELASLGMIA